MALVGVKVKYFVGFVFSVVLVACILIPVELSRAQQGTADIRVTKRDDPDPVTVGEELTYTVTVTNLGPATAASVTLQDIIFGLTPDGGQLTSVDFVSASNGCSGRENSVGGGATGVFIDCVLGDLSSGETRVVTYVVSPTAVGTVQNFVDSNSETDDSNPDNDFDFTETQVIPVSPQPAVAAVPTPLALQIGQESQSGDVDLSFEVSSSGDYAQQCVAPLQFTNTGNLQNAQGSVQYGSEVGDVGFEGGSYTFEPAIEAGCDQAVQQSAAASSVYP